MPATVLAQTWRGGAGRQHHLTVALASAVVAALDESAALDVGQLLGGHDRVDVPDGHVATLAAARPGRPVATSDRADLEHLGIAPEHILDV